MSWNRRMFFLLLLISTAVVLILNFDSIRYKAFERELPEDFVLLRNLTKGQGPPICDIKPMDPFDESIKQYITPPHEPLPCKSVQTQHAILEDFHLRILRNDLNCSYRSIDHNTGVSDLVPKYGDWVYVKGNSTKIESDFIEVKCSQENIMGIFQNVFSKSLQQIVPRNTSVETGKEFVRDSSRPNVLMLGFDGASRSSFFRQMPQTLKVMNDLGFVTMDQHSKLGDNTFPNLMTILMGKRGYLSAEFPAEVIDDWGVDYDNFTEIMWRRFSRSGYATLFAEDRPEMGTFTYREKSFGFIKKKPTDHYQRPFYLNTYPSLTSKLSVPLCYDEIPLHKLLFDYIEKFHRTYHNLSIPTFSFNWEVELAHDLLNTLGVADGDLAEFLDRNRHLWKNTVVIIMSDHGNRYNEIRETIVGRMESRLPFLSILLPESLSKEYPHLKENLEANSKKFSTHFDTHEMLNDILKNNFSNHQFSHTSRGHSLLGIVPKNRTCPQLNIPDAYCPCLDEVVLDVEKGRQAAAELTRAVNQIIRDSKSKDLCLPLELDEILSASARLPPRGVVADRGIEGNPTSMKIIYRVSIRMKAPSKAVLEAVLSRDLDSGKWTLDGDIERNNKYGSTSWCATDRNVQKYCYCKIQKE